MSFNLPLDDIQHRIDSARANHSEKGFENPQDLIEALTMVVEALRASEAHRRKIEGNIAKRLGILMSQGLDGDFIKDVILNGKPNYPYGEDDPEQLEFDKMVDNALREALRAK